MHKPYSLLSGLAQSILEATGKGRKLRGHFSHSSTLETENSGEMRRNRQSFLLRSDSEGPKASIFVHLFVQHQGVVVDLWMAILLVGEPFERSSCRILPV